MGSEIITTYILYATIYLKTLFEFRFAFWKRAIRMVKDNAH